MVAAFAYGTEVHMGIEKIVPRCFAYNPCTSNVSNVTRWYINSTCRMWPLKSATNNHAAPEGLYKRHYSKQNALCFKTLGQCDVSSSLIDRPWWISKSEGP